MQNRYRKHTYCCSDPMWPMMISVFFDVLLVFGGSSSQRERSLLQFNPKRRNEKAHCYSLTQSVATRTLTATVQPKALQRERSLLQFNPKRCNENARWHVEQGYLATENAHRQDRNPIKLKVVASPAKPHISYRTRQ